MFSPPARTLVSLCQYWYLSQLIGLDESFCHCNVIFVSSVQAKALSSTVLFNSIFGVMQSSHDLQLLRGSMSWWSFNPGHDAVFPKRCNGDAAFFFLNFFKLTASSFKRSLDEAVMIHYYWFHCLSRVQTVDKPQNELHYTRKTIAFKYFNHSPSLSVQKICWCVDGECVNWNSISP